MRHIKFGDGTINLDMVAASVFLGTHVKLLMQDNDTIVQLTGETMKTFERWAKHKGPLNDNPVYTRISEKVEEFREYYTDTDPLSLLDIIKAEAHFARERRDDKEYTRRATQNIAIYAILILERFGFPQRQELS